MHMSALRGPAAGQHTRKEFAIAAAFLACHFVVCASAPRWMFHRGVLSWTVPRMPRSGCLLSAARCSAVAGSARGAGSNQGPRTLSYNPAESAVLITSDADGGTYELYIVPKDAASGREPSPVRAAESDLRAFLVMGQEMGGKSEGQELQHAAVWAWLPLQQAHALPPLRPACLLPSLRLAPCLSQRHAARTTGCR
jgi:hypothetical protein